MLKVKVIDIRYSNSSIIENELNDFINEKKLSKSEILQIDYVYNNRYVESILIYYEK